MGLFMSEPNATSAIASAEDLLQAYATGHRNFVGANLASANLSHADLKGVDLSYADLSTADLSYANLRGADLSYVNLEEANLSQADLRGAMLIGTNLRHALLESTLFEAADYDPESTHFPETFKPERAGLRPDR